MTKTCSRCHVDRDIDQFHRDAKTSDGHQRWCRPCSSESARERYARDGARQRLQQKEYYRANRLAKYNAGRRHRLRQRGLTPDDYEAMLREQGGQCAICGGFQRGGGFLCIDHDHAAGKVRGLLCHDCNVALGRFHDDPARLAAAILYLTAAGA